MEIKRQMAVGGALLALAGPGVAQTGVDLRRGDLVRIDGAVTIGPNTVARREAKGRLEEVTLDSATVRTESGELLRFSPRDVERLQVYTGTRVHFGRAVYTVPIGALLGGAVMGIFQASRFPCEPALLSRRNCEAEEANRNDGKALATGALAGALAGLFVAVIPTAHWVDVDRGGLVVDTFGGGVFLGVRIRP
jgi:hypothetical protein